MAEVLFFNLSSVAYRLYKNRIYEYKSQQFVLLTNQINLCFICETKAPKTFSRMGVLDFMDDWSRADLENKPSAARKNFDANWSLERSRASESDE